MLHGQLGSRTTGPELRWPQADWEAHISDSLSARLKRRGSSNDNSSHAHNRVASQQCTCLDTQALAVLVQGDQEQPAWHKLKLLGGKGTLARRLRRLGGQSGEMLASLVPCLAGMRGSSDG